MEMNKARHEALQKSLRDAFTEDPEDGRLKLALLKESFEYQGWFDGLLERYEQTKGKASDWPVRDFKRFGLVQLHLFLTDPHWKNDRRYVLDLINPHNDEDACPGAVASYVLARLFCTRAVQFALVGKRLDMEAASGFFIETILKRGLKPEERLLMVDLSKKKAQIMKEFEQFYERARLRNEDKPWWPQHAERRRAETRTHLEVWKLRKQRKRFSDIARALDFKTVDAAKKSFYRAYELTQGKRYDRETFKAEAARVKRADIKQTCDTCPNRKDCDVLCPEMLRYADQDAVALREKSMPTILY